MRPCKQNRCGQAEAVDSDDDQVNNATRTTYQRRPDMSDGRLRVLLSEGSSTSARQTLYGLGRQYIIDIVDPSPWCQCRFSRLVRRWYRCPCLGKNPIGYVAFVRNQLRRQRYDVLFPTHEQVYVLSKYRDLLSREIGLAVPEFDALRHLQSKAEFARLLVQLGLPTPETRIVRFERELPPHFGFPCYLKLCHSTASHGVRRLERREELDKALHCFQLAGAWSPGEEIIIQQPASGVLSVVNAVFQQGRLIATHCTEILATGIGGGPSIRISASHPHVVADVQRLGAHLNWHGPLLLEYFIDRASGRVQYIEANPRIGETVNARLCGVDLCGLVVQVALGNQVTPETPGANGVKSHTGFIITLADAFNGASRWQLLGGIWSRWKRTGHYSSCENEMTRPREDWCSLIPAAATTLRLVAFPRSARKLSWNTVANYALPDSAAQIIEQLSDDDLERHLRDWEPGWTLKH